MTLRSSWTLNLMNGRQVVLMPKNYIFPVVFRFQKVLDEKNEEIKQLKSIHPISPTPSSVDGSAELKLQIESLNKMVNERDDTIFELQTHLKSATGEIENSADLVNELITERDINRGKIEKFNNIVEEFKVKVQAHNIKMQEMQEEIIYLNKTCNSKDKDVNIISLNMFVLDRKNFIFSRLQTKIIFSHILIAIPLKIVFGIN